MSHDPLKDGISSVNLIWVAGSDLEVVNDARVSFQKEHAKFEEPADRKLIQYLAKHGHWTPFAGSIAKFQIKMPLFVAREWFRHTVGFNRNEVSGRYVVSEKQFYVPTEWRMQAQDKKQGSSEAVSSLSKGLANLAVVQAAGSLDLYKLMIQNGVAGEMARTVLPQSMYTEFRETASIAAYARLCSLRISSDAQTETKAFAEAVSLELAEKFPISWEALTTWSK